MESEELSPSSYCVVKTPGGMLKKNNRQSTSQEITIRETTDEQQTINPHAITISENNAEDLPSPLGEDGDENRQNSDDRQRAMYGAMYGTELNEAESEVGSQAESDRSGDKYQPTPPEISDDEYNSHKTPHGNRK